MKSWILHVPREAIPGDARALSRAVVVPDAFSWFAFFLPAIWFLVNRVWTGVALVLVGFVVAGFCAGLIGLGVGATFLIQLAFHLYVGLEANAYRGWRLARTGLKPVDAILASDRIDAEKLLFARWLNGAAVDVSLSAASVVGAGSHRGSAENRVVGLFPEPEAYR